MPSALVSFVLLVVACSGGDSSSKVAPPGDERTGKDKLLNTGAELLQTETRLRQFSTYLDGFHFYNGNIHAQMEAHHYVHQLNEDLYQAFIFDGNGKDAKIMGVEYIMSPKLFNMLSDEEKLLWHSHHYEVSSGTLVAPGLPGLAEHELMEKLISTYGKTIHTWHTDQQRELPLGAPMVMMGFTRDGQLDPQLIAERDARFEILTEKIKQQRADIPTPRVDPLANAWEQGKLRQFILTDQVDSAAHKHQGPP